MENNYLSHAQRSDRDKEMAACSNTACQLQVGAKWDAISLGQDAAYTAGMVVGVPQGVYDGIEGLSNALANPVQTYEAIKQLLASDDMFSTVSDAVKQSYIERINKLEADYQRAGASGAYDAGVEAGKLFTDVAGLVAGGAGLVKTGTNLTQKITTIAKGAGTKVDDVAAGMVNAGKGAKGNNLSHLTAEQQKLIKNAESISTAKPGKQVTAPRDLNEQVVWKQVQENPSSGVKFSDRGQNLNTDPRFPKEAGFEKMSATQKLSDGRVIEIHYQYNSNTGKAYDMKIVTPQRIQSNPKDVIDTIKDKTK